MGREWPDLGDITRPISGDFRGNFEARGPLGAGSQPPDDVPGLDAFRTGEPGWKPPSTLAFKSKYIYNRLNARPYLLGTWVFWFTSGWLPVYYTSEGVNTATCLRGPEMAET